MALNVFGFQKMKRHKTALLVRAGAHCKYSYSRTALQFTYSKCQDTDTDTHGWAGLLEFSLDGCRSCAVFCLNLWSRICYDRLSFIRVATISLEHLSKNSLGIERNFKKRGVSHVLWHETTPHPVCLNFIIVFC